MRGRWRTKHPSPPRPANQTTGATAARRRGRAHTARQAERARQRREDDRRDSGDGRARAPRATDFGQRPKDAGGCAPAPAKITARVRPPKGGSTKRGRGERPAGAAGEGERPDAKPSAAPRPTANQTPEQPPTTAPGGAPRARNRTGSRTTARRGDAKQSAASGQAAQADDGETASGRGSRPTPPHATARREPRQRTAKRRRDGRRRRRPGGNRTRGPSRRPAASAEKKPDRTPQHARDRRGGREPRRPRAAARTHAGRGHLARTRRRPASRERNGPTPERRAGARKPGQGRRGKRQERRRAHRPAKRRERRERREPPARSWPAAAATLGREACAKLCRQPFPCPLSCVFRVWVG